MNGPNFSKGKAVASKILKVIFSPKEGTETSPIIDGNEILTKEVAAKEIKFNNVWFKYPLEDSRWVLKNFNLTIKPGQ
jgi:ABC-type multidrug transport system fused ATPase/permease subunit